jgi:hypothetical protein
VLQSGPTKHEARISVDSLTKHLFLTGMTGAGKTTSAFNLLVQLHQLGIPFLVVEPVKNEYRSLATTVRSLQVFTLGDEETAPFRLNIFEPPPGVKVQTHVEHLAAIWNSSFVMHAPLCYVVKDILAQTYRACGWNIAEYRRGRPIMLADLRAQSEKVSRLTGYELNVLMNIEAAFRTRITSLSLGGKGPLLDTITSTPIESILRRPTVIELGNIGDNQEQAFLAALVLTNVMEYVQAKGRSKELKHVTLIEEAHRLLPNISTQKGDPESADPLKSVVEQIARMLAEVRAYGEGLVIVEQIPTKIIPDAIKNTATKIAHRVPAADDRQVLAGAMNLTKEQSAVFTALKPGEAILSVESHPLPIRIAVPDIIGRLGLGDFSDDAVRRHMNDFYLRNPLPKAPPRLLDELILSTVDTDWFKGKFMETYRVWLKTGDIIPLGDLVVDAAKKHSRNDEETLAIAGKMLSLAVGFYLPFDEKDRSTFPRLFMRQVERSMRDGRRG